MSEKSPSVVVLSMPFCGVCHSLMDWMTKSGIEYVEKNVKDAGVREEAEKLLGHEVEGTPLTIINSAIIIEGFDRKAILAALGK